LRIKHVAVPGRREGEGQARGWLVGARRAMSSKSNCLTSCTRGESWPWINCGHSPLELSRIKSLIASCSFSDNLCLRFCLDSLASGRGELQIKNNSARFYNSSEIIARAAVSQKHLIKPLREGVTSIAHTSRIN
jgi:hypothetical protein